MHRHSEPVFAPKCLKHVEIWEPDEKFYGKPFQRHELLRYCVIQKISKAVFAIDATVRHQCWSRIAFGKFMNLVKEKFSAISKMVKFILKKLEKRRSLFVY